MALVSTLATEQQYSERILMLDWFQKWLKHRSPADGSKHRRLSADQQRCAQQDAARLVLYHFNSCPYCRRVRRVMRRLEVTIALRDIHADTQALQALVAGGGRRTVPCLSIETDNDVIWLYESAAIIDYLRQHFDTGERPS